MKIMPNRMDRGFYMYQKEFEDKALEVLRSGWYILGKEVRAFEEEFASYTGAKELSFIYFQFLNLELCNSNSEDLHLFRG